MCHHAVMRRCLVASVTVFAATLIAVPANAPAGSIVRGPVYLEAYRDPVATVVLPDRKTGYHPAQWNL
jgi:hypothetical protein